MVKEERGCTGGRCQLKTESISNTTGDAPDINHRGRGRSSTEFRVLYHLQSFIYSQWSEWSPCTKNCRTKRYRACELTAVCGNSIIQEDALCYVEGSHCEKLYKEKKSKLDIPSKEDSGYNEANGELLDDEKCGIPGVKDMSTNLRIIGGREATKGRWPWQVAVLNKFHEPFCGGTLLSSQFILTAAHCIRRRLFIRAGEHDLLSEEGSEQEVRVAEIFVHPDYDAETVDNDIALLRLRTPLKLNKYVAPACLPSIDDNMDVNSLGYILGWGKRKNSAIFGTDVLHQAQVPVADMADCRTVYEDYYISPNMLCAGYKRGRVDSCAGDSGGPLLFDKNGKWYVYGITSFGEGCGRKGKYGIYAKVPNFVNWIRKTVHKNSKI